MGRLRWVQGSHVGLNFNNNSNNNNNNTNTNSNNIKNSSNDPDRITRFLGPCLACRKSSRKPWKQKQQQNKNNRNSMTVTRQRECVCRYVRVRARDVIYLRLHLVPLVCRTQRYSDARTEKKKKKKGFSWWINLIRNPFFFLKFILFFLFFLSLTHIFIYVSWFWPLE